MSSASSERVRTVMVLTADQAFELARRFHDLAVAVGNFRFDNWAAIPPLHRRQLEDLEFWILDYSSKLNALSIQIDVDDLKPLLDRVTQATDAMKQSIAEAKSINSAIRIATAAVTLGAAIVAMNPAAIASAVTNALDAAA